MFQLQLHQKPTEQDHAHRLHAVLITNVMFTVLK